MSVEVVIKRNDLPKASARLELATERRLGLIRQRVVQVARSLARVDTGEMRDGIVVVPDGVAGTAPHTVHNEYGTEFMSAQPMLRPALAVAAASTGQVFDGYVVDLLG